MYLVRTLASLSLIQLQMPDSVAGTKMAQEISTATGISITSQLDQVSEDRRVVEKQTKEKNAKSCIVSHNFSFFGSFTYSQLLPRRTRMIAWVVTSSTSQCVAWAVTPDPPPPMLILIPMTKILNPKHHIASVARCH